MDPLGPPMNKMKMWSSFLNDFLKKWRFYSEIFGKRAYFKAFSGIVSYMKMLSTKFKSRTCMHIYIYIPKICNLQHMDSLYLFYFNHNAFWELERHSKTFYLTNLLVWYDFCNIWHFLPTFILMRNFPWIRLKMIIFSHLYSS